MIILQGFFRLRTVARLTGFAVYTGDSSAGSKPNSVLNVADGQNCQTEPHECRNIAAEPKHVATLKAMKRQLQR